jgi:hypothetical protein
MMQKLQRLPTPLRVLAYAAAAAAVLTLAAGVGAMAALTLGSDAGPSEGAKPARVEGESRGGHEKGDKSEGNAEGGVSGVSSSAAYSKGVATIQKDSVKVSLESNDRLLRYDALTANDVGKMEANYVALESLSRRAKDLDPPAEYEGQHNVFVSAIGELRDAAELAYRLVADPSSATQANFESYDRHVDRATAYLRTSNEKLGKDFKTTAGAREISF